MLIDPRHLEQLAAIIDHGTLHEAAKQLGSSQPALSRMLRTLESRIGVQLFARNSRPLVPTEIGRKLSDQGRAIRAARLRAAEDVRYGTRGMSGELKIGAPPFLCERLVGDIIADFFKDRPEIAVELVSDYFPSLERRIANNQIDILICPITLLVNSKTELTVEPLFTDRHVIACRSGHPLESRGNITASELEATTWIGHSRHSMLRIDMAKALESIGVANLHFGFESESAGAIFEMLRQTDFLTVLPEYVIGRLQADRRISNLPIELNTSPQAVGMMNQSRRSGSPLLNAFKDHVRDFIASTKSLHVDE
jgi:DNA-binding transcriptional LysR family regulator